MPETYIYHIYQNVVQRYSFRKNVRLYLLCLAKKVSRVNALGTPDNESQKGVKNLI